MANELPVLLVIGGPTASGKTNYAIELAKYYDTEIVSTDSRQAYKEISIGTAKPTTSELEVVKHHFINHCSIHDNYNAGLFEKESLNVLKELFKSKRVVIAAGGTGLYIKALCEGLDDLPQAHENLRITLQNELDESGLPILFSKLESLDPEGSRTIDRFNPQRVMRALELVMVSGKSLLELKTKTIVPRPFRIIKIMMNVERDIVYQRINSRVDSMVANGLIEEAKSVYPFRKLNALSTVGYSELFDYFENKYTLEEAVDKIKQHTRNYAKRQLTWFRNDGGWIMHDQFDPEK